jgi:ABC-type multidrug transport system ATPase subunit
MKISLKNVGKRYSREWIFKKIDYEFDNTDSYSIIGANGSGKSTLLQAIAGNLLPDEGNITYHSKGRDISSEDLYSHLSIATPYLELYEEYTLMEAIEFHSKFKKFFNGLMADEIIKVSNLEKAKDKQLKYFSSGMKQRVKLTLAILSDTPLLLLDEPCTNLDKEGVEWYQKLINSHSDSRLIIVCSNQQKQEYEFCKKELDLKNYKNPGLTSL